MGRVDATEGVEKLSAFDLQSERQTRRLQKRFFELDLGFVVVVELEHDIREPFEVRIDCAVQCDLGIPAVESALLRIVIAHLEMIEMPLARSRDGKQAVERDVHVVLVTAAAQDRDRLGQRRACIRS